MNRLTLKRVWIAEGVEGGGMCNRTTSLFCVIVSQAMSKCQHDLISCESSCIDSDTTIIINYVKLKSVCGNGI